MKASLLPQLSLQPVLTLHSGYEVPTKAKKFSKG
jgi:hypothetical protein